MTNSATQKIRHIKVNQIVYDYKPKRTPANFVMPPVPWVQLKGKWLEKAGFTIDTPIRIEVSEGRLVLTAE
ncbi:MAG: SymE family type I addiction module toxin [Exilibacterium sp.]